MIVLVDWFVNFVATIIFLMVSFLYKLEPSDVDTIDNHEKVADFIIF